MRRTWHQIARVLTILGLINLFSTLVKWVTLIHWLAEKYSGVREWLFGWLPIHIPPLWHDPIVLLLILFSVTNIGLYRETRMTYLLWIFFSIKEALFAGPGPLHERRHAPNLKRYQWNLYNYDEIVFGVIVFPILLMCLISIIIFSLSDIRLFPESVPFIFDVIVATFIISFYALVATAVVIVSYRLFIGIIFAWRWVLTTAAIFAALVAVNEIYVLWLAPMVEH